MGLRTLLEDSTCIKVVGEAGSIIDGIAEAHRLAPDVAVIDIRLADGNGLEACRQIKGKLNSRVLILTSYLDEALVVEALAAGADGYLLKQVEDQDIVGAIQQVALGNTVMDPAATRRMIAHHGTASRPGTTTQLTGQERRVLHLVSTGRTNREIAHALELAERTVRNYLNNIFSKLQVSRRSEATAWFIKQQIDEKRRA